jgi:hypothetical protein
MNEYDVNPMIWFSQRELPYPPVHFVPVTTQLTEESKQWVLDHLQGRFSIAVDATDFLFNLNSLGSISFEDPKEAVIFELKWS